MRCYNSLSSSIVCEIAVCKQERYTSCKQFTQKLLHILIKIVPRYTYYSYYSRAMVFSKLSENNCMLQLAFINYCFSNICLD